MGIPKFLPDVEKTAGRLVDLREYKGRRIAIDISGWIQRECFANCEMLADEKHLSNFGRAILLDQQQQQLQQEGHDEAEEEKQKKEEAILKYRQKVCNSVIDDLVRFRDSTESKILVVLDGATPPIKWNTVQLRKRKRDEELDERDRPVDVTDDAPAMERRYKANRRAGAGKHFLPIVDAIVESLRAQKIPFLVAPYEADGQLAYLQLLEVVDLVITNDSDLVAYGPLTPILLKVSRDEERNWTRGIIVRRSDLGAIVPGSKPSALSLIDLSPAMLAVFFTASGGDYCRKLPGIGVIKVATAMKEVFLPKTKPSKEEAHPLGKMIQLMISYSWNSKHMSDAEKVQFERDFIAAVFMYRHSLVYDPIQGKCCTMTPLDQPDIELAGYAPYQELVADTDQHHTLIGKSFPPDIATYIAEGWICPKRMILRNAATIPDKVKAALQAYKDGLQQDEAMVDDTPTDQDVAAEPDIFATTRTHSGMATTSRYEIEQETAQMDTAQENDPQQRMESASDDEVDDNAMETQEL